MPVNDGAMFSIGARGTFKKEVIYYQVNNQQRSRSYAVPIQPNTPAQLSARDLFRLSMVSYHQTTSDTKKSWNEFAKQYHGSGRSGYNCYISSCLIYLESSQGVIPVQPFLPGNEYNPNITYKITGILDGYIESLEAKQAKIIFRDHNSQVNLYSLTLTNFQEIYTSINLGPRLVDVIFSITEPPIPDPKSYTSIDLTQPGMVPDINFTLTVPPQYGIISGELNGQISQLGILNCTIYLLNSETSEEFTRIGLSDNQTTYQIPDLPVGTYNVFFDGTGVLYASPESYLNIEVTAGNNSIGNNFNISY